MGMIFTFAIVGVWLTLGIWAVVLQFLYAQEHVGTVLSLMMFLFLPISYLIVPLWAGFADGNWFIAKISYAAALLHMILNIVVGVTVALVATWSRLGTGYSWMSAKAPPIPPQLVEAPQSQPRPIETIATQPRAFEKIREPPKAQPEGLMNISQMGSQPPATFTKSLRRCIHCSSSSEHYYDPRRNYLRCLACSYESVVGM